MGGSWLGFPQAELGWEEGVLGRGTALAKEWCVQDRGCLQSVGGVQRRSEGSAEMTGWPHIMDLLGNLNEPDSTLSIRNPTKSPGDL